MAAGGASIVGPGASTVGGGGTGIPPVTTGIGGAGVGGAAGAGVGGSGTTTAGGASIDGGSGAGGTSGGTAGSGGASIDGGCPLCPILYWNFDDTSSTQAMDSSGHGFDGTYIGSPTPPTPSLLVPPKITFLDPMSRQFAIASRQAVHLANAPALLKPSNNITLTVWYRATGTDTVGGGLISMGDNYLLFLHRASAGTIELSKVRQQLGDAGNVWIICSGTGPGYLDGNWHHLAGVISSTGMRLYFDGALIASSPEVSNIIYPLGTDLFVGKHGNGVLGFNFDGNIDEVRIYGRVLSEAEIGRLAQGGM